MQNSISKCEVRVKIAVSMYQPFKTAKKGKQCCQVKKINTLFQISRSFMTCPCESTHFVFRVPINNFCTYKIGAHEQIGAVRLVALSRRAGEGRWWQSDRTSAHCHKLLDFTPENPKNLSLLEKKMSLVTYERTLKLIFCLGFLTKFKSFFGAFPIALIAFLFYFLFEDTHN